METRVLTGFIVIVVILISFGAFVAYESLPISSTTSSSSSNSINGIVAGIVIVGPSQPLCRENQSCNVNLNGYSLQFTSVCQVAACQSYFAAIGPSGHYSILLSPGRYLIVGLFPSCNWLGCSITFPQPVEVLAGLQIVVNINIDTGIR